MEEYWGWYQKRKEQTYPRSSLGELLGEEKFSKARNQTSVDERQLRVSKDKPQGPVDHRGANFLLSEGKQSRHQTKKRLAKSAEKMGVVEFSPLPN